jgi:hypothetical protein
MENATMSPAATYRNFPAGSMIKAFGAFDNPKGEAATGVSAPLLLTVNAKTPAALPF